MEERHRCTARNANRKRYPRYAGRAFSVCEHGGLAWPRNHHLSKGQGKQLAASCSVGSGQISSCTSFCAEEVDNVCSVWRHGNIADAVRKKLDVHGLRSSSLLRWKAQRDRFYNIAVKVLEDNALPL